jgi:hypothetical protein
MELVLGPTVAGTKARFATVIPMVRECMRIGIVDMKGHGKMESVLDMELAFGPMAKNATKASGRTIYPMVKECTRPETGADTKGLSHMANFRDMEYALGQTGTYTKANIRTVYLMDRECSSTMMENDMRVH